MPLASAPVTTLICIRTGDAGCSRSIQRQREQQKGACDGNVDRVDYKRQGRRCDKRYASRWVIERSWPQALRGQHHGEQPDVADKQHPQ